jgi:hypothetical protein
MSDSTKEQGIEPAQNKPEQNKPEQNKPAKPNTTRTIIIVGVAIVLTIGISAYYIIQSLANQRIIETTPGPEGWVIDEDNIQEVLAEMEEKVAEGYFETSMNMIWTFPSWREPSTDAFIANSAANNFPAWFDIVLDETGETICVSPLIPVGSQIKELKLNQKVPKGEHAVTITFHMVDQTETDEEAQKKGDLAMGARIIMQSN